MAPFARVGENARRAVERKAGVDHRHDLLSGVAVVGVIQNGISRDAGSVHEPSPGYLPRNPLYVGDFTNQRSRSHGLADEVERRKNRAKSGMPSKIDHPFAVIKRVFGFVKVPTSLAQRAPSGVGDVQTD
jgi:hypothetical protein